MFSRMALAAMMSLGMAGGMTMATAEPFQDPDLCVAEIDKLDANNDGFVDNTEWPSISEVHKNVDVDGDGRISQDEKTVSCEEGVVEFFESPV